MQPRPDDRARSPQPLNRVKEAIIFRPASVPVKAPPAQPKNWRILMKTAQLFKLSALTMALGFAVSGGAWALDNATQEVTITVPEINDIAVSGSPTLTIVTPEAGALFADAVASGSWDITTNVPDPSTKKLTAVLDEVMPTGLTLQIAVTAPATGTSGSVTYEATFGTAAADVVSAISAVSQSGMAIDYTLSADATATPGDHSKQVTYTLTDS